MPSWEKCAPLSPGTGFGEDCGFTTGYWLNPEFRGARVFGEVYVGDRVDEPFAVWGDVGVAEAAHLHHVFEGHGTFCLSGGEGGE